MTQILEKLRKKFGKEKLIRYAVIIGVAGMVLILLSDCIPQKKDNSSVKSEYVDTSEYAESVEKQLAEILRKIDGVGRVEVMVTISGTEEYVYAEELDESKSDGSAVSQHRSKYVIIENNGEKEALVNKVNNPQISGVVIVCDGGGNAKVCETVYKTVSTVLGIPMKNIYVTKLG